MSYTVLYRKFRPTRFDEIIGQEHIAKTLVNQILSNRIGHAYLFNGGRGTGKTSTAKILARAINCINPKQDGEPCNECELCKSILEGSLPDVVEMDAASNNGVDDIRQIRDEVNFLPTVAKYRVYIIDEVHMLSTGAFNALLKTLEEPPAHVKFILATTEPQKLPATILSRCQRFDFKQISVEDIIKRLQFICKESKIDITDQALKLIAVLSEGALRDSISILERCIQENDGQIDENNVRDLVGIPKLTYTNQIVKNILEQDPEKAMLNINKIIEEGKDLDNFLFEIIKYIKDILLFKSKCTLNIYNNEEIKDIEKLSKETTKTELLKLIYSFSELAHDMKWSSQKTLVFQSGIIKSCITLNDNEQKNQEEKINIVEEETDVKVAENISKEKIKTIEIKEETKTDIISEAKETYLPTNQKTTKQDDKSKDKECLSYWPKILEELKKNGKLMVCTNLIGTKAKKINDLIIGIEFKGKINPFAKTVLEQYENKAELEKMISIEEGKKIQVKYLEEADSKKEDIIKEDNLESLAKQADIPINIIEE